VTSVTGLYDESVDERVIPVLLLLLLVTKTPVDEWIYDVLSLPVEGVLVPYVDGHGVLSEMLVS